MEAKAASLMIEKRQACLEKLDLIGPVDNRPYTDLLHLFVKK